MSTRSRAKPWFRQDVTIEEIRVWRIPGAYLCEHGTAIDPTPWTGTSCFECDLVKARRLMLGDGLRFEREDFGKYFEASWK